MKAVFKDMDENEILVLIRFADESSCAIANFSTFGAPFTDEAIEEWLTVALRETAPGYTIRCTDENSFSVIGPKIVSLHEANRAGDIEKAKGAMIKLMLGLLRRLGDAVSEARSRATKLFSVCPRPPSITYGSGERTCLSARASGAASSPAAR